VIFKFFNLLDSPLSLENLQHPQLILIATTLFGK
jgi:hypothetical protein